MCCGMSGKDAVGCTRDASAPLALSQRIPSAHNGESCTIRVFRNAGDLNKEQTPCLSAREGIPQGHTVLAGCLQFTLTSRDKRKFESLRDKPGCLKDSSCDKDVVNIANITPAFRGSRWGSVKGEGWITAARFGVLLF